MISYKKKIKNRIQNKVFEYCYHDLKEVKVKSKQGLFNHKCFWNACHYVTTHKKYKVVMGIYYDKENKCCYLHFWVRKDGLDYEVTLGYLAAYNTYFEIRIIEEWDYSIISTVFSDALKYYKLKLTTRFERFIIGDDRIV